MKKLLIFDFDGTIIINSNEKYMACFDEAIKSVGVNQDFDWQYQKLLGSWGQGQCEMLVSAMPNDLEKVDSAVEHFKTCTLASDFFTGVTIVDGAVKALTELKDAGHTLAIASGSRREPINDLLAEFKIDHLFSEILSSTEISDPAKRKPNPYMLEVLMKKLGFKKTDTYYIGDATTDMQAAESGGVYAVAALTGHMDQEEAQSMKPDHIIESITDLKSIL